MFKFIFTKYKDLCLKSLQQGLDLYTLEHITAKANDGLFVDEQFWIYSLQ